MPESVCLSFCPKELDLLILSTFRAMQIDVPMNLDFDNTHNHTTQSGRDMEFARRGESSGHTSPAIATAATAGRLVITRRRPANSQHLKDGVAKTEESVVRLKSHP